jgi:2-oxo-4-hydroxy-4-carboxy-5-ureidoimidazoline decarboxylase
MTPPVADVDVGAFNAVPAAELAPILLACCSSRAWVGPMLASRPYRGVADVLEASDASVAAMTESDLDSALEGHPRIGEPLTDAGAESSRHEQAGVADAEDSVRRALAEGNRAYERRFGHVYLVSAAGRGARELLELLDERLANDPATERAVLRHELATINRLRLERLLRP